MATKRHSNDDDIQPMQAGGSFAQGIVELLSATHSGLVFWSRHPFEVAAELQLRLHSSALPGSESLSGDGWLVKSGFVVQCKPARRANGSVGFHISVLYVPTDSVPESGENGAFIPGFNRARATRFLGLN